MNKDTQWSSSTWTEQNCPFLITAVSPSVLYKEFIHAGSVTKLSIPLLWSIYLYLHLYNITIIIITLYKVLLLERTNLSIVLLFKTRLQSIWKLGCCWLLFTDKMQPFIISVKNGAWFTTVTNLRMYRKEFDSHFSFSDTRQYHQRLKMQLWILKSRP